MKIKDVKLILLGLTFIFFSKNVIADSPLTSTPFSKAYDDLEIIAKAKNGTMTQEIAEYLHSESTPVDQKAAVINALGWNSDGNNNNAQEYSNLTFSKVLSDDDMLSLNSGDAFVIGYLMAMGAYQNPGSSLPFLERAQNLLSSSFTVNIIYAMVKAQKEMENDFCNVWKYTNKVFENDQLTMDMREGARKIIYDYMLSYKDSCK